MYKMRHLIALFAVAVFLAFLPPEVVAQPKGNFIVKGRRIQKWDPVSKTYKNHLFKGMAYSPYPVGTMGTFPGPFDFICAWNGGSNTCPAGYNIFDAQLFTPLMSRDFPLMKAVGVNTVHVYARATSKIFPTFSPLLLYAKAYNLDVLVHYPVPTLDFTNGNQQTFFINDFTAYVKALEADPSASAIVGYVFGNENNIRWCKNCNPVTQARAFYAMANRAFVSAKKNNPNILTTIATADIADIVAYNSLVPNMDFWSSNVYRGDSFNNAQSKLFDDVVKATTKPFVITEFGVDSYDDRGNGKMDEANQSKNLKLLVAEIGAEHKSSRGAVSGGFIFEWTDEWWKHNGQWNKTSLTQELKGAGWSNSANSPDRFSNEESYGILKIVPGQGITDTLVPKQAAIDLFLGKIW